VPWSPTAPGAAILPGAAYDGYADRGESENRNTGTQDRLLADRLSDHRYFANLFRLYLHTAAYNLLVHMRRAVPIRRTSRPARRFLWKRSPAVNVVVGTTAAASATRWAKATLHLAHPADQGCRPRT